MDPFETGPDSITWRGGGQTLFVQAWGPDSVRVRCAPGAEIYDNDFALMSPAVSQPVIEADAAQATLVNGEVTVVLRAWDFYDEQVQYQTYKCSVEIRDAQGRTLLRELDSGGSLKLEARNFRPIVGGGHHVTMAFEGPVDEKLYGMGQYQQDVLDIKGSTFELAHRNSQASVPFVMSSAGYGFLWHNPAIGRATFAANRTEWVAEATDQLDYWITVGGSPAAITAAYADATGHAPMMPEYGLGYWQCKLRYWNQEQLLEVAREHKRRGLPLDVIVADFFHWPKMGDFRFEEEFWPNPKAMVEELNDMGVELMVSVWPQISVESENFPRLKKDNLLVRTERGIDLQMGFEGPSVFLDVTNPRSREVVWEICKRNYFDLGIRAFWLDEAEPEYGVYDFDNYRYHQGSNLQVGNIYPQAYARAFYEGQKAAGQEDVVNLLRCVWAGSQRYGALAWSGDIHSTFEDMRRQITAGLHMGIAGIPWFTTDIGGFHDGNIHDSDFHDLLIRWFQFATFCPVMRMHGDRTPYEDVTTAQGDRRLRSGAPNELWSFGEPVYEVLAKYVHLRESLRPYVRDLMRGAHKDGQPVMRAMFHEFPADTTCWELSDQFMFGGQLLVAPIVQPHSTRRDVYLPAGATWTELHTGEKIAGGQWITADAASDVIPVYAKDDAFPELVGAI